jgi:RNA polymerase sigma-70 factor (ECF subfamily)
LQRLPSDARSSNKFAEGVNDWIVQSAPRALAYARTLVRNDAVAEDLVQDCFQRLLAKADRYDLRTDGTRLLFRAVTNACINWTQRRSPVVSLEQIPIDQRDGHVSEVNGPLEKALLNELSGAIDAALAELPVEQRAAVELHAMGHAANDIAEALETTPGNARILLHRGRQRMAERLKPYLDS